MTVFPIHIIELLTLALVLLGVYRVFKALSCESTHPENQDILRRQEITKQDKSPQHRSVDKTVIELQQACNSARTSMPLLETSETKTQSTVKPTQAHSQAVLKSYIGDFF